MTTWFRLRLRTISRPRGSERLATRRPALVLPPVRRVFGVDFSGARLAGANAWVAALTPAPGGRLTLDALDRLADLAGAAERAPALRHLVGLVRASPAGSVWGFDFPFGTPVELLPPGAGWNHHLGLVRAFGDEAYAWGLELIRRAEALGLAKHVRRESDRVHRTPFDTYHYRINRGHRHSAETACFPAIRTGPQSP